MAIEQWLLVIGILTLVFASLAFYNAMTANFRASRIHEFLAHIEQRVILIERDVQRRLMKDGVEHADVPHVHDIKPTFKEAEQQTLEMYRRMKN